MSEKAILAVAYSAVSAFGLWLLIDVDGWFATVVGLVLMFFAGTGLAGMAKFGSTDRAINFQKSGEVSPVFQLSSLIFAKNISNFSIDLSDHEINEVYAWGQFTAPGIMYPTAYHRPRVMPAQIGFPVCAVGEFAALSSILEKRGDQVRLKILDQAVSAFIDQFEGDIENLRFHLSR